jgi:hypothetical protein
MDPEEIPNANLGSQFGVPTRALGTPTPFAQQAQAQRATAQRSQAVSQAAAGRQELANNYADMEANIRQRLGGTTMLGGSALGNAAKLFGPSASSAAGVTKAVVNGLGKLPRSHFDAAGTGRDIFGTVHRGF